MSQVFKDGDRLVLALGEEPKPAGKGFNFQMLSPLLLGLLLPFMAASYLDPETLRHLKWPIWIFLCTMFVVCTALFFYTHHVPGRVESLVVNRDSRTLEIRWHNLLATASQVVPFRDIAALRVRYDYDEHGNPVATAELVLRSRAPILLPDNISEQQLRPLRAAIGLG